MGIYGHKFDALLEDSKIGNEPLDKKEPTQAHPHEERINHPKPKKEIQQIENNPDEDEFDKELREENK